jgi:hypothetical protein
MLLPYLVLIVVGLALVFFGRRVIWLIVGAAAFALVYSLATTRLGLTSGNVALIAAAVAGVAVPVLAGSLTRLVVTIAGMVLVGLALTTVAHLLGLAVYSTPWLILFVVGGLAGLMLIGFAYRFGLVVVSALGGATLVAIGLLGLGSIPPAVLLIVLVLLALAGFLAQGAGVKG